MASLSTPEITPEWRDNCVRFSLSGLSRQKSRQNGAIPDLRHPESANRDKNPDRLSGLQCQVSQGWHCRAFGVLPSSKGDIPPRITPFWRNKKPGQRWAIRSRLVFRPAVRIPLSLNTRQGYPDRKPDIVSG